MTQWEYKILSFNELNTEKLHLELNKMGEDGWELISTGTEFVFKRQKNKILNERVEHTHAGDQKKMFCKL